MFFVIIFSGKIGSGKSSISKLFAESFKFQRVSFGDYVRQIANNKGIEHSRINLQNLGESLIKENSFQFCFNVLSQANLNSEPLVVDGLRHVIALNEIKKIVFPNKVYHIHLNVSENLRFDRINLRNKTNVEDIIKNDSHISEKQVIHTLNQIADFIVDSDKSVDKILADLNEWLLNLNS